MRNPHLSKMCLKIANLSGFKWMLLSAVVALSLETPIISSKCYIWPCHRHHEAVCPDCWPGLQSSYSPMSRSCQVRGGFHNQGCARHLVVLQGERLQLSTVTGERGCKLQRVLNGDAPTPLDLSLEMSFCRPFLYIESIVFLITAAWEGSAVLTSGIVGFFECFAFGFVFIRWMLGTIFSQVLSVL